MSDAEAGSGMNGTCSSTTDSGTVSSVRSPTSASSLELVDRVEQLVALAGAKGRVHQHVRQPAGLEPVEVLAGLDGFDRPDVLGEPVGPHPLVGQRGEGDPLGDELIDELEHLVARPEQEHDRALVLDERPADHPDEIEHRLVRVALDRPAFLAGI